MPQRIRIKAGDTEPLEISISARVDGAALADLDDLTAAVLYLRKRGEEENHVDGVSVTPTSGLVVSFDPVDAKNGGGDALDVPGIYRGYLLCTWSDGDVTRHPGDPNLDLYVEVAANYE